MPIADYLDLLDASARQIRADKTGYTLADVAPIFERLNLDPDYWKLQIKDFGRLFANVAGFTSTAGLLAMIGLASHPV